MNILSLPSFYLERFNQVLGLQSPLPPSTAALSSHSIQEQHLLDAAWQAQVPDERKKELRGLAQKFLYEENEGNPYVKTTLRHFSHIHGSTILQDDTLEGGNAADSLAYWLALMIQWENGKAQIVDPKLSKLALAKLKTSLQDCLAFLNLYASTEPDLGHKILEFLSSKLDKPKSSCYMPSGWAGSPGHFMLIKFTDCGDQIALELMTKGGGSRFHDVISRGSKKEKISYKSIPVMVDRSILFSKVGASFCQRIRNMLDPNFNRQNDTTELDAADLYGLVNLLAADTPQDKAETIRSSKPPLGVTPQRSGTCSDTGLRMPLYEAIFEAHSLDTMTNHKRVLFAFKFQSLVDFFRQMKDQLHDISRGTAEIRPDDTSLADCCRFLEHAAYEHMTRLTKLYPEKITDDELMLGLAIGEEILDKVQKTNGKIKSLLAPGELPSLYDLHPIQQLEALPPLDEINKSVDQKNPILDSAKEDRFAHIPDLFALPPSPEKLLETLDDWFKKLCPKILPLSDSSNYYGHNVYLTKPRDSEKFYQLIMLIETLPLPTGEIEDPYWDRIPIPQRAKCLEKLARMGLLAGALFPWNCFLPPLVYAHVRLYDIACQLAPSIPELQMSGLGFESGILDLIDIDYQSVFNRDAELWKKFVQIKSTFDKRQKRQNIPANGYLFPIELSLPKQASSKNERIPELHWWYLQRFFTPDIKAKLMEEKKRSNSSLSLEAMFVEKHQLFLPSAYTLLQTLAGLNYAFFLTGSSNSTVFNIRARLALSDPTTREMPEDGFTLPYYMYRPKTDKFVLYCFQGNLDTSIHSDELTASPLLDNYLRTSYNKANSGAKFSENEIFIMQPELKDFSNSEIFIILPELKDFSNSELLSKATLEELAMIPILREVQIFESLDWGMANLHLVKHPAIQACLQEYLICGSLLQESLRRDPQKIVNKIRDFLLCVLERYYFRHFNLGIVLWLTRLGTYFNHHIHVSASANGLKVLLPDFYLLLADQIDGKSRNQKITILDHMLLSFVCKHLGSLSEEEIAHLLAAKIRLHAIQGPPYKMSASDYIHNTPSFISQAAFNEGQEEGLKAFSKHLPQIRQWIKDASIGQRNTLFNTVLNGLLNLKDLNLEWQATEKNLSEFSSGDYTINLNALMGYRQGSEICDPPESITTCMRYREVFGTHIFPVVQLNGVYYSEPDRNIRISNAEHLYKLRIQKKLAIHGEEKWFEYLRDPSEEDLGLPADFSSSSHQLLQSCEIPSTLLITEKESGRFLYEYQSPNGWMTLNPATGTPTGERIIDFQSAKQDPQFREHWLRFFTKIEDMRNIILKEKSLEDGTWKITKIQFPRLDLTFTAEEVNGLLRLKSDQYQDYYLALQANRNPVGGLASALHLEDKSGRSLYILPAMNAAKKLFVDNGPRYFLYHGSTEQFLKPETPRAALFLALRLREIGNFLLAHHFLKMSEGMESDGFLEHYLVQEFLLSDRMPTSLSLAAFDLHLDLRMKNQAAKHTKASFIESDPEDTNILKNPYYKEHMKKMAAYYAAASSDLKERISAIPPELRLTPQEEKDSNVVRIKNNKQSMKHHFQLFEAGEFKTCFSEYFEKKFIASRQKIQSLKEKLQEDFKDVNSTPIPADFIRLPINHSKKGYSLMHVFFELYDRACSKNPYERLLVKMDLFFLARLFPADTIKMDLLKLSRIRSSGLYSPFSRENRFVFLLRTLALIVDHPSEFHSLQQFSPHKDRPAIFEEIITKCASIESRELFKIWNWWKGFATIHLESKQPAIAEYIPIPTKIQIPKITVTLKNKLTDLEASHKTPFYTLYQKHFRAEDQVPSKNAEFPLQNLPRKGALAQKLLDNLKKGHLLNMSKKTSKYLLKNTSDFSQIHIDLVGELKTCERYVKSLTADIESLANKIPPQDIQRWLLHQTKQSGKQMKRLTLQDPLISCFLVQDPHPMLEANPLLTQQDVQHIFKKMAELFLVGRRLKLTEESLKLTNRMLDPGSSDEQESLIQQLGSILSSETAYTIDSNPAYLVYEYAAGMILRKEQVQLLDWIMNSIEAGSLQHLLFQFKAGGGKTKVLMPILAFLLAHRGLFPILVNYSSLYEVGKRDLDASLSAAFKQRLELLEVELGTLLSPEKVWAIKNSLEQYFHNKKSLAVKTETIYALLLSRKSAYEDRNAKLLAALDELLDFFKTKSISLIDEAHLSLDSLQEVNQATGNPETIPLIQQELLINLTLMLAGLKGSILLQTPEGSISIADKVRLLQNKQAILTDDDLIIIREALITEIILEYPFSSLPNLPVIKTLGIDARTLRNELAQFLFDWKQTYSNWLQSLHASSDEGDRMLASTIVLAKKFLHSIMPHTLGLVQGIAYGDSIQDGDFTCSPWHDRKPVTSKFQDVFITAALTVQNTLQSGLKIPAIKKLMEILVQENTKQRAVLHSPIDQTMAERLFENFWKNGPLLDTFDVNNAELIAQCMEKFGRNPDAIALFLKQVSLPQIKLYKQKISLTPPDLIAAFGKTISFTATPGLLELYPQQLHTYGASELDPGFEAAVVEVLCRKENSTIIETQNNDLNNLFEQVYATNTEICKRLTTLIDSGGIFHSHSNHEVVEAFLRFANQKGIPRSGAIFKENKLDTTSDLIDSGGIFHSHSNHEVVESFLRFANQKGIPRSGAIFKENKLDTSSDGCLNLLKLEGNHSHKQQLVGSDLPKALQRIGENFYEILLITLFGLEDTTGADYKQPDKGVALLSVGERQSKTRTVQAAMRMRRLLLGNEGQTVCWMIDKELSRQIPRNQRPELTVVDLFSWMIDNEAHLLEKAIVMRACQGIRHLIQSIAWNDINSKTSASRKIARYRTFREGLVDHLDTDPYFSCGSIEKNDTEQTLRSYGLNCYRALGYTDNLLAKMCEKERNAYEMLIGQTAALIERISTGQSQLAGQMFQRQEMQQEQRQEVKQEVTQSDKPMDGLLPTIERYSSTLDNFLDPVFLCQQYVQNPAKFQHYRLKELLNIDFIFDDIYVSSQFFQIARQGKGQIISKLRPFKYVLVLQENVKGDLVRKYLPCSLEATRHYLKQLRGESTIQQAKVLRQAALVKITGEIVENGSGVYGFSTTDLIELKNSAVLKERMALLEFMNGKIPNLTLLLHLTHNVKETTLDQAWKIIQDMKIGVRDLDHNVFNELKRIRKTYNVDR
jgi:hypothetical protein